MRVRIVQILTLVLLLPKSRGSFYRLYTFAVRAQWDWKLAVGTCPRPTSAYREGVRTVLMKGQTDNLKALTR